MTAGSGALPGVLALALALTVGAPGARALVLSQTFDDPTVTNGDFFGRSVAIDGGSVLVGAPNDDTKGPFVGQAHLFTAAATVPEPATLTLLIAGLLGFFGLAVRGLRAADA